MAYVNDVITLSDCLCSELELTHYNNNWCYVWLRCNKLQIHIAWFLVKLFLPYLNLGTSRDYKLLSAIIKEKKTRQKCNDHYVFKSKGLNSRKRI